MVPESSSVLFCLHSLLSLLNDMVSLKEYVLDAIGPFNVHISPNYDKNNKKVLVNTMLEQLFMLNNMEINVRAILPIGNGPNTRFLEYF